MLAPSIPTYPPTTSTYGLPVAWQPYQPTPEATGLGTKSPNPSQPRGQETLPTGGRRQYEGFMDISGIYGPLVRKVRRSAGQLQSSRWATTSVVSGNYSRSDGHLQS